MCARVLCRPVFATSFPPCVCATVGPKHLQRVCVCFFHLKPIPQPTAWDTDGFDLQLPRFSPLMLKAFALLHLCPTESAGTGGNATN